jgi:hypothetical protein
MEHAKIEINVLEKALEVAQEVQLRELQELQLVFVGGGCGEVVFA